MITRLLPLFEQYATPQAVELMRGQLAGLSGSVREETRKRDDDMLRRGIRDEEPAADNEQSLLDQIDRAKTSEQRDQLYVELILRTVGRGDLRARGQNRKFGSAQASEIIRGFESHDLLN